jgi:hypothetical protein
MFVVSLGLRAVSNQDIHVYFAPIGRPSQRYVTIGLAYWARDGENE